MLPILPWATYTSSERLVCVQFTSCFLGKFITEAAAQRCLKKSARKPPTKARKGLRHAAFLI